MSKDEECHIKSRELTCLEDNHIYVSIYKARINEENAANEKRHGIHSVFKQIIQEITFF
jgi:hypothetical protein